VMYEVPSRKDVERVVITAEAVLENVNPTLVPRDVARRTPREKSPDQDRRESPALQVEPHLHHQRRERSDARVPGW